MNTGRRFPVEIHRETSGGLVTSQSRDLDYKRALCLLEETDPVQRAKQQHLHL